MSDDETDHHHPAETIAPTEVSVPCPHCGAKRTFDFMQIEEDDSGCFSIGDEHRYDRCEGCDEMVDYGAVWLRPIPEVVREFPPSPDRACMEKSAFILERLEHLWLEALHKLPEGLLDVISQAKAQIRDLTESYLDACAENDRLRGDHQ